jgi:tetratricopeptide (TPR) repeat protein
MIPDEFSMPQPARSGGKSGVRRDLRSVLRHWRPWLPRLGGPVLLVVLGLVCTRIIDASGIKARVLADLAKVGGDNREACSALQKPRGVSVVSQSSVVVCEKLVHLKPADVPARVLLGNAYVEVGRTQEAVVSYQEALGLDPDCFDAHLGLGKIAFDRGAYVEAAGWYRKALKIRPRSADAQLSLGLALSNAGRYEEAMQAFQKAKELDPEVVDTQVLTGRRYLEAGMPAQAIECLKDAVQTDQQHAQAYFNLGRAYLRVGDRGLALQQERALRNLDPPLADQLQGLINRSPQDQNAL